MLRRFVLAVLVAVITVLGCLFVGQLLTDLTVNLAIQCGQFLEKHADVFGIIAGLWFFFTNA